MDTDDACCASCAADEQARGPVTRFYTTESISPHRERTPEGFLLCREVAVARVGVQLYAKNELPSVEASQDGLIKVERLPEEVFRPETIASFNGKPVTNDHPPVGMLTPHTWRNYVVGTVLNPRRGDGIKLDNDFLYADLLIQDSDTIKSIEDGKREVSAGYDAQYEVIAPGHARQRDIVGNHVALVDKGRCGPHCAIGDEAVAITARDFIGDKAMASKLKAFKDKFRRRVMARDAEGALNLLSELKEDDELMGEVVSDALEGEPVASHSSSPDGHHHITVNLHGGRAAHDEPEPPPGAAEPAGATRPPMPGAGSESSAEGQILQRLERLEQLIVEVLGGAEGGGAEPAMAGGEEEENLAGEEPEDGMGTMHDRRTRDRRVRDRRFRDRRTRDEENLIEQEAEWRYANPGAEQGGSGKSNEPENEGEEEFSASRPVPEEARGATPSISPRGTSHDRRNGTRDSRRATHDAAVHGEFMDMLSKAEALVPGIALPTYDTAADGREMRQRMDSFRRRTLDAAYKTEDGKARIDRLIGGRGVRSFFDRAITADAVTLAFNGAAALAMSENHIARRPLAGMNNGFGNGSAKVPTPADINRINRDFFSGKAA